MAAVSSSRKGQGIWANLLARLSGNHMGTLAWVIAENALGFVASAQVARMLKPEGRGELGRWLFLGQLVITVGTLGLNSALPQLLGAGRLTMGEVRRMANRFCLVFAPLAILAVLSLSGFSGGASGQRSSNGWWWIVFLYVPSMLISTVFQGVLVAGGQVRWMMAIRVASRGCYVLGIIALFFVNARSVGLVALLLALTSIITTLAFILHASPASPLAARPGVFFDVLRRGFTNNVPTIMFAFISCINQGWVFMRFPDAEAGLFSTAYNTALILDFVGFTEIANSTVAMSNPITGQQSANVAFRRTGFLVGTALCFGYVLAPFAFPLVYGADFLPAVSTFRILLAGQAVYNLGRIAEAALQSSGFPKVSWMFQLAQGAGLGFYVLVLGVRNQRDVAIATASAAALATFVSVLSLLWVRRQFVGERADAVTYVQPALK